MESERDHLTRLAKGEIASFDVLFVRYYPLVLHFIMGFVKNEEDARDLSQDLFLKLWLHREKMPEVVIEDAPLFAWRGFHLDLARHMFTKAYLKKTIDRLAGYKINKLHLHLNDDQGWRLESAAYPLLTETGGWRTFDKYDSICIRKSADDPTMALDKRFLRDDTLYGGYYT